MTSGRLNQTRGTPTHNAVSRPTRIHLVVCTNTNNVKISIISTSLDQAQYKHPAAAWRRILQPTTHATTMMSLQSFTGSKQIPKPSPTNRKRGRPTGSRNLCSKPKALRGVKIGRTEQNVSSSTSADTTNHPTSVAQSSDPLTVQPGSLSHTTPVAQSTPNHSPDRET